MPDKKVILLTGISGFLGSHIAEKLSQSFMVIGLVRQGSNQWRLKEIQKDGIHLLNMDETGWKEKLATYQPEVLIHAAWAGVAANERNEYTSQARNIVLAADILELSETLGIKKVIALGSQAEYGYYEDTVDEFSSCKPTSAYGACKLAAQHILEAYCSSRKIDWYWLRLFPLYGTREDPNWFLPMVITHAIQDKDLDLTPCEQKYSYLHVDDFACAVEKVVNNNAPSGIYNLSGREGNSLRYYVNIIREKTGTKAAFNFGALSYRPFQVMNMTGDAEKFYRHFDFIPKERFENKIDEMINYYQAFLKKKTS